MDTLAKFAMVLRNGPPAVPMGAFDEESAGAPPKFDELRSWIAHPRRASGARTVEDANHITVRGSPLPLIDHRPCDCFFVVDSCFGSADVAAFRGEGVAEQWNLPLEAKGISAQQLSAKVTEQMEMRVAAGASCFNRTCRIYAPKYRQAHVGSFAHLRMLARVSEDPEMEVGPAKPRELAQALDLAYSDVRRAFLHFLNEPETVGRPFILAGHSQGVLHLLRLLQEEVEDHSEVRERFVHAYLTGFSVPLDIFSRSLRRIRPSRFASDVCSVSSWRTAAVRHPSLKLLRVAAFYAGEGWRITQGKMLTNNPITWSGIPEDRASDPAAFCGALWPLPSNLDPRIEEGLIPSGAGLRFGRRLMGSRETLGVEVSQLVEVDCGPITARVDSEDVVRVPHVSKTSLFGLTERDYLLYHDLDFALFHCNIQKNVAQRVRTWQASGNLTSSL